MLTPEDLKKIKKMLKKELSIAFSKIEKKLDELNANLAQRQQIDELSQRIDNYIATVNEYAQKNGTELKGIRDELKEFIAIMKHFSKEQKILIRKMQEIEDYFDPQVRN